MANCPKCGVKLKITDWKPNCPKCGVNLVYYGMEERLLADADRAESEHAIFQKRIDRLKASFTGSKLTVLRIVLSVLPVAALFLPLAQVVLNAPFIERNTTVNALSLFGAFSSMDFGGIMALSGSGLLGKPALYFMLATVLMVLTMLLLFLNLVFLMLSCSPRGKSRNITVNSLMLVFTGLAIAFFSLCSSGFDAVIPTIFQGSLSFGAYVLVVCLAALLGINLVLAKQGVEVKYKETFVNGIPSDIYFEAVKAGEDIRALAEQYAPKEEEEAAEAEAAVPVS